MRAGVCMTRKRLSRPALFLIPDAPFGWQRLPTFRATPLGVEWRILAEERHHECVRSPTPGPGQGRSLGLRTTAASCVLSVPHKGQAPGAQGGVVPPSLVPAGDRGVPRALGTAWQGTKGLSVQAPVPGTWPRSSHGCASSRWRARPLPWVVGREAGGSIGPERRRHLESPPAPLRAPHRKLPASHLLVPAPRGACGKALRGQAVQPSRRVGPSSARPAPRRAGHPAPRRRPSQRPRREAGGMGEPPPPPHALSLPASPRAGPNAGGRGQ